MKWFLFLKFVHARFYILLEYYKLAMFKKALWLVSGSS